MLLALPLLTGLSYRALGLSHLVGGLTGGLVLSRLLPGLLQVLTGLLQGLLSAGGVPISKRIGRLLQGLRRVGIRARQGLSRLLELIGESLLLVRAHR